MKDLPVIAALTRARVPFTLIGAHACAVWGYSRYTADIDILTLDVTLLDRLFWPEDARGFIQSLRRGDSDDPLRGVIRFSSPPIDVIIGRGPIAKAAVSSAVIDPLLGIPVTQPLELALLKLEAGSLKDAADVFALAQALRMTTGEDLPTAIRAVHSTLSDWGQRAWARVEQSLAEASSPR